MATIEAIIVNTPPTLRRDARRAAGQVVEFGGWIAQDSGDLAAAQRLTSRAEDHLRAADPELRAMIWMRRSNIEMRRDPSLAIELAADAAAAIEGLPVGRLAASIARQQALAAVAGRDQAAFTAHTARATELATSAPVEGDLAIYATPAYVATETATGLIVFGNAEKAIAQLAQYLTDWPADQQRDYAVLLCV